MATVLSRALRSLVVAVVAVSLGGLPDTTPVVASSAAAATAAASRGTLVVSPRPGQTYAPGKVRVEVRTSSLRAWYVRLNGRDITAELSLDHHGHASLRASASDGLSTGRNVLRVAGTALSGAERSQTVRFTVRRGLPLVGAGQDATISVRSTGRLRADLDPRTSAVAQRWTIRRAPKGSRLVGSHGSGLLSTRRQATFDPDRIGRYVVHLRVHDRRGRVATDTVRVTAVDPRRLVPIDTDVKRNGAWGIQVGSRFYAEAKAVTPLPTEVQILVLDRSSLAFVSNETIDETVEGKDAELAALGPTKLVIAAVHRDRFSPLDSNPPSKPGMNTSFDSIGVRSDQLPGTDPEVCGATFGTFSAIGVPGAASAVTASALPSECRRFEVAAPPAEITGYLSPDSLGNYSWLPTDHPSVDTRAPGSTADTGVVAIGAPGVDVTDSLPPGATGGFQLVDLQSRSLKVRSHAAYATAGVPPATILANLRALLDKVTAAQSGDHTVVLSSIGDPALSAWYGTGPDQVFTGDAITSLADAVAALGGVRSTVTALVSPNAAAPPPKHTYGLVGWSGARSGTAAETSDVVPGDVLEGRVTGSLVRDNAQRFVADDQYLTGGQGNQELLDAIYAPATSWPEGDDPGKQAALAYIGLNTPVGNSDLRTLYWSSTRSDAAWNTEMQWIDKLTYPDDEGFSRADFQ